MNFQNRRKVFIAAFLLCIVAAAVAQDSVTQKIYLKGFIKDLQSVSFTGNSNSLMTGNLLHNRINFRWDIASNLSLRLEARNRLYYGETVKMTPQFGKFIDDDHGYVDLSYNVIDESTMLLNTTLDRALISWAGKKLEVTVGRQRINWGVNLVWNPNDIFNTYNYFDFDYEERPGNDAVRIQYNTGMFSSVQAAFKPSRATNRQIAALMYKTNSKGYDIQMLAGIFEQDLVVGTGWAGNINKSGFKGELSYFHPQKNAGDTSGILIGSISLDRTFKGDYFATVSYLYNSNGRDVISSTGDLLNVNLSAKTLMPFTHSFFGQISKSFTPLLTGSVAVMYSPAKNTCILFPSLSYSISDDWDVSLIAQSFFAYLPQAYRSLGNSIYLRLRWSF